MQSTCDFESEVVISGISGKFPLSENLDEFWENLVNGTDMVTDCSTRFNAEAYDVPSRMAVINNLGKFDAEYFGVHGKQAAAMDPRIALLLELTYEAIMDAGINPETIKGSRTGVFVAGCESEIGAIGKRMSTSPNPYGILGNVGSMLANRISFSFDLNGPSYVVDTACSSSSVALQQALLSIRNGLCDAAIVASAHTHHDPIASQCFYKMKMITADGKCKVFDAAADGYVRAEAAAAIYICKKQVAKRSYGTLVHANTNSDGYKEQGITFPSEVQQERIIRQVYTECGISPLEVDYVEVHGTGTKVGDPEEMLAVTKVFCEGRQGPLLVGSVKSNMGHPEPVAGLCQIAKILVANAKGIIPANLHYHTPNPDIPALHDGRLKVVDTNQPFNAKYVGLNSMGFGGTNVHILLRLSPRVEQQEEQCSPSVPIILACFGRTQEAVQTLLEKALVHRQNRNFVNLLHGIFKHDSPKHEFRGYVIVESDNMEIQVDRRSYGRERWFVFTGLGSQWAGMSRDLKKFDAFQKSVNKSALTLLKNHDFDIISLFECGDTKKFEDFKNSVVSITTIQIALVDLLKTIGIEPDGIIGHSTGEVAAGYADGCLTQEEAVLTSFARVRAVLESNLQPGIVASVGLTWEEAKARCPPGVYPAIHNAKENVTIAGPPDLVTDFIKQLESEGIFAKLVRSASFGFHSPLVAESGKLAKVLLEKILVDPKPRSKKWLSSSVPEDRWDTDLAKYCSADYYVNNGVNPVYFYTTLLHTPANSVVFEIAPHCFMQSILNQTLPKDTVKVGMIHVKSPDNCVYFLNSIGKAYQAGLNVDLAALYTPVQYPVPPSTPHISPLLQWDHSATREIPHHSQELSNQKGIKCTYHLMTEQDAFLEGHSIDGKILFPATGYMFLAWKCFSQQQGFRFDKFPVVMENVRFDRMTLLSKRNETDFVVNIFTGSGKFEITESDIPVCSGTIRCVDETAAKEMLKYDVCEDIDMSGPSINKEDFYKEFHLRGYRHSGLFQGIEQTDMTGKWAKVKWQGEWISFIDTILQAFLLRNDSRDLYVPIRVQKCTIDPIEVQRHLDANGGVAEVKSWEVFKSGTCPGIELRGLNFAKFNQKSRQPSPTMVEQVFLPYLGRATLLSSEAKALEVSLEIAVENSSGPKFFFAEILKHPENMISNLIPQVSMLKFPAFESRVVNESEASLDEELLEGGMAKLITFKDLQSREPNHVIFVDEETRILDAASFVLPNGFILFKGFSIYLNALPNLSLVSEKRYRQDDKEASFYLLRRLLPLPSKTEIVRTDTGGYSWLETAKQALKLLPGLDRVYFVSEHSKSGIVGFIKCLVQESSSEKLRCYHAIDDFTLDLNQPSESLLIQIKKDLLYNVFKDNSWGTLSNRTIPTEEFQKLKVSTCAYANALTLGELSSLSWIESPLKTETKELIEVHYSSLNFRDVMLASGKLVQDALTEKPERPDCVMGIEFSGKYKGNRVCGMGMSECLATQISPENKALLDIPDDWTFEEAATVPCVYVTVYIALILRGKMRPGESILIHAGSGGVGQAAIQVALSMKCRVFTTVSTEAKRKFLKERFPDLTDESFANSRDAQDFESHIYKHTKGKGVNLVLNSLAQDKLFASIRCLSINGRFLEIGKFDVFNDTRIGMSILSKGVSVYGILADQMIAQGSSEESNKLMDYMRTGMKDGTIRPLTYHVFQHNQLEEAFRFMAQGKHVGKVILQVKENDSKPATLPAVPRTYFAGEKSYIIIGGLGGMGFELANWMVERGARNIVLTSRSGIKSSYHMYHFGVWERIGAKIIVDESDASNRDGAFALLENATKLGPIGGIFNAAVVLKDALFDNQSEADFEDVIKCKGDASHHLDALSRKMAPELDYFVVFSSIIAARGNPGQTNYGFANSVMERICEQRKAEGLPALAVQWGAVGDVGVFYRTMKDKRAFGLAPQSIKSCFATLDLCLQQDRTIVSSYVPFQLKQAGPVDANDRLVNIAANILGIKDLKKTNFKTPLVDLGLDSLMGAELAQVLQSRANLQLSQKAYSQLTFEMLAEIDAKGSLEGSNETDGARQDLDKVLTLRHVSKSAVVKMKSLENNKDIVFIVHPMDGTVMMLEELVSHLDAPVYGIECVSGAPLESTQKLANYYLKKVREVQPCGPYKIAGYSFGGAVAFEMVLQLESQNEMVSVLMLLDASPSVKLIKQNTVGGEAAKEEWENELFLGYVSQYKSNISPSNLKELSEIKTTSGKLDYVSQLLHETYPDISVAEIKDLAAGFLARAQCLLSYEAGDKVKARTVLVKALKTKVDKSVPYDYGLSEVCENLVEVIEIDGNHYCFYEKPTELCIPAVVNKILE